MKLSKIQQIIFGAVVVVVVVVVLFYQFLLKPLNADITSLQTDLKDKQDKLEAAKQTLAKYDEFKKKSATTLRELEWAQGRMPPQLDRPKFIDSISALQTRSGVSLTNFKFITAPTSKDSFTEVPANVKLTGNFSQLMEFLYEVSVSKNLMIVHDLKLGPFVDTASNTKRTLSVDMTLSGIQGKK